MLGSDYGLEFVSLCSEICALCVFSLLTVALRAEIQLKLRVKRTRVAKGNTPLELLKNAVT